MAPNSHHGHEQPAIAENAARRTRLHHRRVPALCDGRRYVSYPTEIPRERAPDPVTAALIRLAHRDEARHVAFGVEHTRYVFEREPELRLSMAAAVERRSQMLASVSGLSPYVHDALVVYAGGGIAIEQIREGARHIARLQREMDRTRRERLESLGFEPAAASQMSSYHTKNFM